jgi:hypothetical protein
MASQSTESKRLLSYIIAEWACSLKYEHLSPRGDSSGEIILVRPDTSPPPRSFTANRNPLFHICDLYDAALCLRVLWILHHGHVQFFLAFAERDVCCAITRGDLKYM